jgi:alpha-1,2-mannosyltransferase
VAEGTGVTSAWLDRRLPWAVATAAVGAVFMAYWLHWFGLVDLGVYRAGATAFLHGRDIYLAHPRLVPLPFTYPPFAAVFFVPFGVLPDWLARGAISLLSGAALVFSVVASLRLVAPSWSLRARATVGLTVAGATPLIEPVRDTFRLGQVNLLLIALVLADMVVILSAGSGADRPDRAIEQAATASSAAVPSPHAWRRPRWLPPGVLIGLATAVKLTPGIFILYLLVLRRTREALIAMGAAVAATLAAAVLMPSASAHYWRHLVFDDRRIGSPGNVWNQSLRGALARLTGSPGGAHLLWLVLALGVGVAGLALAVEIHRGGEPLLGLGLAALTGLLVSPISWNHHWVWFIPLAIGLARRAVVTGRRLDRWLAAGWVATFCVASMSWWPFAHQDNYRLGPLYTVAADAYVLAALAVAGVLAWRAWVAQPVPSPIAPGPGG